MPKSEYEQMWGKPIEADQESECVSCKSTNIARQFCGEYICNNCGKGFGVCNLQNSRPDPYIQTKKKIKSTD